jgi:hypothetical protein
MLGSISNLFGRKAPIPHKGGPLFPEASPNFSALQRRGADDRKQTYSKVFRWRLPDGHTKEPQTVEVIGSFTHWKRVSLSKDSLLGAWTGTIHHIEGNRTHHYMLMVDGEPAHDRNSDGMAVPSGPQEERFALKTERGPRVFMLFGQAK